VNLPLQGSRILSAGIPLTCLRASEETSVDFDDWNKSEFVEKYSACKIMHRGTRLNAIATLAVVTI